METFYIELLNEITGGGVLGTATYAVINILASDDLKGQNINPDIKKKQSKQK
jgi:hypothetical protein